MVIHKAIDKYDAAWEQMQEALRTIFEQLRQDKVAIRLNTEDSCKDVVVYEVDSEYVTFKTPQSLRDVLLKYSYRDFDICPVYRSGETYEFNLRV